ncbi:hypothetical protein [Gallaecimonas mangrovi]|uniref:hypothetical protein n=1 Tax=Gallaecimonas mangrovi TaxID=2291597 RepID=UPI000E207D27|nr:hypothetical protein [Gallaecimonas mangrovi]
MNKKAPLYALSILFSFITTNALADTDQHHQGVKAHQKLEKQKESLTHAKDYKEKSSTKNHQLFDYSVKKDDAKTDTTSADKSHD